MTRVSRAFTLIELLIVVAIIGILAAIAVPNFMNAQTRAKMSRTYSDLKALHTAMEAYFVDNNHYPPDYDSGLVPGASVSRNEYLTYSKLTTPVAYMGSIPLDPFFIGALGSGQFATATDKPVAYFQYAGPHSGKLQPRGGVWAETNTIYTMTSLGPDKIDQKAWSYAHTYVGPVIYNMSNGLKSLGDLYMSNHGIRF